MSLLRVVLADDHALILESLALTLKDEFDIVGTAVDGGALIAEAERLRPDLILLDLRLPVLNGLQAARQISRTVPEAKLVFLTQHGGREYIQAAFRAGARAYVLKDVIRTELLAALTEVVAGRYYVTPRLLSAEVQSRFDPAKNPGELFGNGISRLQRDILVHLRSGRDEEDIGRRLRLPAAAIRSEIEELSEEWNARSKRELVRYAVTSGLIAPTEAVNEATGAPTNELRAN